jgi:ribosomal protein S18 acetylase RimI-like enzyme
MTEFSLVQSLETRLVNAWPSLECQLAGGWILRFAKGYSKRANSATPLLPGARLKDDLIDHVVGQFDVQGIRPCFRLNSLEADDVDARLAERGFEEVEPTFGMVAELDGQAPEEIAAEHVVRIDTKVDPRWVRGAASAYGGAKADDSVLIEIVSRIRLPHAFATLDLDDEPVAWGLAVTERGYVGLYDVVVAPDLRGLGLSRTIMTELMAWGRGEGATRAYLQVREENEVARALYRSLGFTDAYRYTHRMPPAKAAPAKRSR